MNQSNKMMKYYLFYLLYKLIFVQPLVFNSPFIQRSNIHKYSSTAIFSFGFNNIKRSKELDDIVDKGITLSRDHSELPNSFNDMIQNAATRTLECISSGNLFCRIDIDTTIGDLTYTSIKSSMPIVKELVNELCISMNLSLPIVNNSMIISQSMLDETAKSIFYPEKTLRILFPDMGAAALARRDWKMGSEYPEVPPCVFTSNIQNDPILDTDRVVIILCPRYSEIDFVKRIMDICTERSIPCILINPELINMDQGFGVRARNIRKTLLGTFIVTYKLITLRDGAIVRDWPKGFSVWKEDAQKDEGYSLLQTFQTDPPKDTIAELFEVS